MRQLTPMRSIATNLNCYPDLS